MFPHTRDILAGLPTLTDLAWWLIHCPDGTIVQECGTLHAAVEKVKFTEAARFIETRRAAAWTRRDDELALPQTVVLPVYAARGMMLEAAKRRDGG